MQDALTFGRIAVAKGFIAPAPLRRAFGVLEASGDTDRLAPFLVEIGLLSEEQVLEIRNTARTHDRKAAAQTTSGTDVMQSPEAPSDPLVGRTVSHFNLLELIERDGLGATYRARDCSSDATASVLIAATPAHLPESHIVAAIERIQRAAAVEHSALEQVLEVGFWGTRIYVAEASSGGERVGATLGRTGRLEPRFAAFLITRIAPGLAHLHARGLLHLAIEPRSLIVDRDGRPKLRDLGRAALRDLLDAGTSPADRPGTPRMAPEILVGESGDARSDLYSLGAVLFELLAGSPPYRETGRRNLVARIRQGPAPSLAAVGGVPDALADLVARCLTPSPRGRFASVQELLGEAATVSAESFERSDPSIVGGPATAPTTPGAPRRPPSDDASDPGDASGAIAVGPGLVLDAAAIARAVGDADAADPARALEVAVGACLARSLAKEAPTAIHEAERLVGARDLAAVVVEVLRRLTDEERWPEVVALGTEAISFVHGDPELHYLTGVALSVEEQHVRAWSQFRRVLQIDPSDTSAWARLADAEVRLGHPDRADEAYRTVLEQAPEHADLHARYAKFLQDVQDDPISAVYHFGRAIALAPERWDLRTRYAWALFEKGETTRAALELETVAENSPSPEAWVMLGRIKLDQGDSGAAQRCFAAAVAIDPDCDEAIGGLLIQSYEARDFVTAIKHARPLVQRHPADTSVRQMLAVSLFRVGRLKEARREFNAILEFEPGSRDAKRGITAVDDAIAGGTDFGTDFGSGTGSTSFGGTSVGARTSSPQHTMAYGPGEKPDVAPTRTMNYEPGDQPVSPTRTMPYGPGENPDDVPPEADKTMDGFEDPSST